jgi:hypothetical protein
VNRDELERMLDEETFSPFVLTTVDGFALPVTNPRKALLGDRPHQRGGRTIGVTAREIYDLALHGGGNDFQATVDWKR